MGWLITLGLVTALAVLPLGIRIRYDSGGPLVRAILGPMKITLYPRKPREEKKQPEQEAKPQTVQPSESLPKPPQPPKQPPGKKQSGGSLTDFIPLVKLGIRFLGDFRRKLRVEELYLRLILASPDPCDLAVNYGKTWAAVGGLLPALEHWFVIKNRDVEVQCDFTASESLVIARMDLTITLGRLLTLVTVYGVRALKEYLNLRNHRKGGGAI